MNKYKYKIIKRFPGWAGELSDDNLMRFIRRYRDEHGFSPSLRELSEAFHKSVWAINRRAKRLIKAQQLSGVSNKARTLRVVSEGDDHA